jgi:hypothetical protein
MSRFSEKIEVKSNLILTARERGKVVARREGHNIWLNLGREWLASVICYSSFTPLTPERDDRVRYMGVGIGGVRQLQLSIANASPFLLPYPGTNTQTDTAPTVTQLERPVRISGSADPYPGLAGDVWIGQVQAPCVHPVATQTVFSRLFSQVEVSYAPFLSVPLSEIGLLTGNANINSYNNVLLAYDTFDTLTKTAAFELEVAWTIRF